MKPSTLVIAALLTLGVTTAASAQTEYLITVDTKPTPSTGGLDFQFNPAGGAADGVVTITNFTFDNPGSLTPPPVLTGGAAGLLPGPVTLTNSTGYNDYFENLTFGNTLSFDATFSGAALNPPPGTTGSSTFAFALTDDSGNPILSTDASGSQAQITINADGTFTPQTFNSAPYGVLATITPVAPAVPEASTTVSFGLLLALGMGGVVLARKHKKTNA